MGTAYSLCSFTSNFCNFPAHLQNTNGFRNRLCVYACVCIAIAFTTKHRDISNKEVAQTRYPNKNILTISHSFIAFGVIIAQAINVYLKLVKKEWIIVSSRCVSRRDPPPSLNKKTKTKTMNVNWSRYFISPLSALISSVHFFTFKVHTSTGSHFNIRRGTSAESPSAGSVCHLLLIPHHSLNVSPVGPFTWRRGRRLDFFVILLQPFFSSFQHRTVFLALPPSDSSSGPSCSTHCEISVLMWRLWVRAAFLKYWYITHMRLLVKKNKQKSQINRRPVLSVQQLMTVTCELGSTLCWNTGILSSL